MYFFSYLYYLLTKQHDFHDLALRNSNYREINATFYDENLNASLKMSNYYYFNCPTDNVYFSFFSKETYKIVRPQLMDPNISRNEKISIIKHKSSSVCYTEYWVGGKTVYCPLIISKNGTFLIFTEKGNNITFYLSIIGFFSTYSEYKAYAMLLDWIVPIIALFIGFILLIFGLLGFCVDKLESKEEEECLNSVIIGEETSKSGSTNPDFENYIEI